MSFTVLAHGLVGRADLPIPAELFGVAAAVVLVVSFGGLAAGWARPRLENTRERVLFRLPLLLEVVCGAIGVALFCVVVYAGLAGTDVGRDNLAPTAVYVLFWVGIPVASLLLGDVFRLFNPWRAVGRAAGRLGRRFGSAGDALSYPEWLGRWPAAAGLLAFGAVELCWGRGDEPGVLAVLALGYALLQLAGMGLYGVETWSRRADAFGVYFGLIATLAPIGGRDGSVVARPPVTGAAGISAMTGTVAVLVAGIGTTMFDGAKEGPLFGAAAPDMQDAFVSAGASKAVGLELAFLVGLLVALAVVGAVYRLGIAGAGGGRETARRFAHSLIPIAAAYVVAHYFSLLAYQGQAAWALASDPLGRGSDLFGTAGREIDYGVVSATAIWYVQVGALVLGHVAALVLAHDRALVLCGSARSATRSQVAMLAVMVAFTCLGLWQLSAANS